MEEDIEDEKHEGRKEKALSGLIQMQKYKDVKKDQHTGSDPYQSRSIPGKALKTAHSVKSKGKRIIALDSQC